MILPEQGLQRLKNSWPLLVFLCSLSIFYNFTHPSFMAIAAPWNILVSSYVGLLTCTLFASVLARRELSTLAFERQFWPLMLAIFIASGTVEQYTDQYNPPSFWSLLHYAYCIAIVVFIFAAISKKQKNPISDAGT